MVHLGPRSDDDDDFVVFQPKNLVMLFVFVLLLSDWLIWFWFVCVCVCVAFFTLVTLFGSFQFFSISLFSILQKRNIITFYMFGNVWNSWFSFPYGLGPNFEWISFFFSFHMLLFNLLHSEHNMLLFSKVFSKQTHRHLIIIRAKEEKTG